LLGLALRHTGHSKSFEVDVHKIEKPGRYFHPLLATLITGAARLMLTTAERLVADHGLDWAFCDTDSIAIAKPETMEGPDFLQRVDRVASWFSVLNPYAFGGSILKVEDVNFRINDKETHEPLCCWGVSAKRYALFNKTEGVPVLRKASAHGLGHMRAPYDDKVPCTTIPAPALKLSKLGVELWQHDLWWTIVRAALDGTPDQVDLSYHPNLNKPALSRYAATSPKLLNWFATYNRNRPYARQVKPFGFLLSLFARELEDTVVILDGGAKPKRQGKPKPISPFDKDLDRALENARDRDTGRVVELEELKTYAEALEQYHVHPEAKFLNGDFVDRGTTERRHVFVRVEEIQLIGKEANRWEEQFFVGLDDEAPVTYRTTGMPKSLRAEFQELVEVFGQRELAERLGLGRATLSKLLAGHTVQIARRRLCEVRRRIAELRVEADDGATARDATRSAIAELIKRVGLKGAAERLDADASNLLKIVRRKRPPSEGLVERMGGGRVP
jgi:transcriptional regulator with XRE-family HTH domain